MVRFDPFDPAIPLTRPTPVDRELLTRLLTDTLDRGWLTNAGPNVARLEEVLGTGLNAPGLLLTSSGTAALTLALRALGCSGEVVTTPLTFAATANAIVLAGARPVFVDVEPTTMNLDPGEVEAAITERTSAILAVHLFGVPCDVVGLADVARRHGLHLIYDAAHAFGEHVQGTPITAFGDACALSFHATKLFSTTEGGALVCRDPAVTETARLMRNHGIVGDEDVLVVGENAKMSELAAAYGLAAWGTLADECAVRRRVAAEYRDRLSGLPGMNVPQVGTWPHYFPLRIGPESRVNRDVVRAGLSELNVTTRRYFPVLCDTTAYATHAHVPHARRAASEVLCLPLHAGLEQAAVQRICDAVESLVR